MPVLAVPEIQSPNEDIFTTGPNILLDPSARTLLPDDMTVLTRFVQFVREDVLREQIPAGKIEIRGSVDPEDDTRQILVRLWIRERSHSEIRRYYQDLGERIDRWAADLPEAQRLDLFTRISFQARRDADSGTL